MVRGGWLEPRAKVPFIGIVGIVLIVAVVAVFLSMGITRVLPDSPVTVHSAADVEQRTVRGSASYVGERDIPLIYKERLHGVLTTKRGSVSLLVDVPAKLLTVTNGNRRDDIVLKAADGKGLTAEFEYDGKQTRVAVSPAERELVWQPLSTFPVIVALTDVVSYEGFFLYNGKQYLFKYHPAGRYATIAAGGDTDTVRLTASDDHLAGTWYDAQGKDHPVLVFPRQLKAVVGELW